jgi:hypothetical protein
MYIIITFIIRWLSEAKRRSGRARQHPKQECRSEWMFTVDAAFDAIDKGAHGSAVSCFRAYQYRSGEPSRGGI